MKVAATLPKKDGVEGREQDKRAEVEVNLGEDLDSAVNLFGKEVVFNSYVDTQVIRAQAQIRRYLSAGLSEADIKEKMAAWKPGVTQRTVGVKKDPMLAFAESISKMSPEEQKAKLAELRQRLQALGAA